MKSNLTASVCVAMFVGIVHTYFLVFCWAYIGAYTPVLRWLVDLGLEGVSLRVALYPIDFLTNVALSVPFALLLVKLCPSQLTLSLVVAVVPSFLWHNYHLVDSSTFAFWPSLLFGWTQQLLALPVAALLVRRLFGPSSPNNVLQDDALKARA